MEGAEHEQFDRMLGWGRERADAQRRKDQVKRSLWLFDRRSFWSHSAGCQSCGKSGLTVLKKPGALLRFKQGRNCSTADLALPLDGRVRKRPLRYVSEAC